jgi:predicted Zn-dependent protease
MKRMKTPGLSMKRLLSVTILAALSACQTVQTTQPGVVGVDRTQRMAVSQAEIDQAAAQQYAQVIADARKNGKLDTNPEQYSRVRAVSTRLIQQTPAFRPDALHWPWEMHVITSSEVNAWCMPGGKIAVYSGLLEKLRLTDDELAAVLGHEMAHALREHARERASEQMGAGMFASVIDAVGSIYGIQGAGNIAGAGLQLGMELPHSRVQETEADRIGVELAARAGYNPHAAVTLWEKMGQLGESEPPQFLSTHPSSATRLQDLTDYAQRVMPLYEQAKNSH